MHTRGWSSTTGGDWTWRNRLRCWVVGHIPTAPHTVQGAPDLEIYMCARCDDCARIRDVNTGRWYHTVGDWADERRAEIEARYPQTLPTPAED